MYFSRHLTEAVYAQIAKVPRGRVVSYGQLAVLSGHPGAARVVGQIAHYGSPHLPWHRLVYTTGALANGYVPGGLYQQKKQLMAEGIIFHHANDVVDMELYQWRP